MGKQTAKTLKLPLALDLVLAGAIASPASAAGSANGEVSVENAIALFSVSGRPGGNAPMRAGRVRMVTVFTADGVGNTVATHGAGTGDAWGDSENVCYIVSA